MIRQNRPPLPDGGRWRNRGRGARHILVFGFCLGLALAGPADRVLGQNPFSLVNLGTNLESVDARIDGRGGWGMAENDTLIPGFKNLASLVGLNKVAVLLNGYGEATKSDFQSVIGSAQRSTYRVLTPTIRAAIPLLGGRGALTAGFRGRRGTQYETVGPKSVFDEDFGGEIEVDEQYLREGTQFDIPIGVAFRLGDKLAAGVSLNLVRGSIKEIISEFFTTDADSNGVLDYFPSNRAQEDELEGVSTTFSVLFGPWSRFHVGASFTPAHGVELKRTVSFDGVAERGQTVYDLDLPQEWSVGVAGWLGGRWRCGLDYDRRDFSSFGGLAEWEDDQDEWTVSFGFERQRAQIRRGGLNNLPLRFGVMRRHWGYRISRPESDGPGQPHPVEEWRISAGTGFPFRQGKGHFDLAVSYGWLGEKEKHGVEDRVWRLTLSVAGLEKWW